MKTIACVLKTGGWKNRHMDIEYQPRQVVWLKKQVDQHVTCAHRFVCLSDVDIPGVDVIPLRDDLPGWWSKMELFRELPEAFYIDLDTVLVGDITKMASHPHQFSVLRNLSSKAKDKIGSGVMAWTGDHSHLYRAFMQDPKKHMAECTTSENWGDQGFIQNVQRQHGGWEYLQDLFPGQIVSYKFDLNKGAPRQNNRIVCFHGQPKPWETDHKWVPPMM